MRSIQLLLVFIAALTLPYSAEGGDSKIARLVADLRGDPMWRSGTFPGVDLPPTASIAHVVASCLDAIIFDDGKVKHYSIRAVEKIPWDNNYLTFVRIASDHGEKIIVMRYVDRRFGWWTKLLRAP